MFSGTRKIAPPGIFSGSGRSIWLLVPDGCRFAGPIAHGVEDPCTQGELTIGACAIPALQRMALGNNRL
jgi:hypothetical protein